MSPSGPTLTPHSSKNASLATITPEEALDKKVEMILGDAALAEARHHAAQGIVTNNSR